MFSQQVENEYFIRIEPVEDFGILVEFLTSGLVSYV